ncbi:copper chaperone [Thermanaeromonas toyohensis ToBE]|uniref:Copper chaperone CopZ n=1 Tax=Thermanaeromonas toyohensis ToBE TaxID=698762 RepID=A0A1W1V6R4_9FIRM|nr:cation transporter [Thermanaeromonas toyohensis]SMB89013.1 copper chaperone [Thermanaeromonas toyohensis ToBE]
MGCCSSAIRSVIRQITLKIEGMTCEHCKRSVEAALQKLGGVKEVAVDLAAGEAAVTYNPGQVTVEELKKAVRQAGYDVIGIVP